ncbi:MAG: PD-(D/E)XK nuclease family protein [Lachnospiraceae bacterium]|nr:PD-(D/E)XK nuclease family protein [Lachnospiraceae bacterium]
MSLQFIFGPSGCGKTYSLYHRIIDESVNNPENRYLILVPEQFTLQTQKDFVTLHPDKGIMQIDVLSFGRLSWRILEETGGLMLPVVDEEAKTLLLRKIALELKDRLGYLRNSIKNIGSLNEVKSVISELMQYGIDVEELEEVITNGSETGGIITDKLKDIVLLYREFRKKINEKFVFPEELPEIAARKAFESNRLVGTTLVLDGFTGFTPIQLKLLGALLKICKEVIVTATIGEGEDPYAYNDNPYQLFALAKQMTTSLRRLANEMQIEIKKDTFLTKSFEPLGKPKQPLQMKSKWFAHLEENIFRKEQKPFDESAKGLFLRSAKNPEEEAWYAAAFIRKIVRENGYSFGDIGVIAGDLNSYANGVSEAFKAFDIPCFIDRSKSLLDNPFIEYLRCVIAMMEEGFSYDSVLRFLRTDIFGFTKDETDSFDNYILAMGIKGFDRYREKWDKLPHGFEESELDALNALRVKFVEKIQDSSLVFKQRKKTVKDLTEALYDFAVKEEFQKRLMSREKEFEAQKELALAKEYNQVYRVLLKVFDTMIELLGDEPISTADFGKLFESALSAEKVGIIPLGADQVVVGDLERTRLKPVKVLLFLGANESYIGNYGHDGLLSEADKDILSGKGITLAPGRKEKVFIQKFYLYLHLTKPSELLYVSYSKTSSSGEAAREAYFVKDLQGIFPSVKIEDTEKLLNPQDIELTNESALRLLTIGLRDYDTNECSSWKELFSIYKNDPDKEKKLQILLNGAFYSCPKERLKEEFAIELYKNAWESISRLETFGKCAFRHFIEFGLRLKERQEYSLEPADKGSICHEALQKYGEKLKELQSNWAQTDDSTRERLILEATQETVNNYRNMILLSTARNKYMVRSLKRMLVTAVNSLTKQLRASRFVPVEYEFLYGNGIIDRIDFCENDRELLVKITDYKTGNQPFDPVLLYHGIQLQLMIYLNAALSEGMKRFPQKIVRAAGAFYYHVKEPLIDKSKLKGSFDSSSIANAIDKELIPCGIFADNADILKALDVNLEDGKSLIIPGAYGKNGFKSFSSSANVKEDELKKIVKYASDKAKQFALASQKGDIDINPFEKGTQSGCDYCKYSHICGFDLAIEGYEKRRIPMKNEEALARLKSEVL